MAKPFLQNMSIRAKVGAALMLVMTGYVAIHLIVDRATITRAIQHYESMQAIRDLHRSERALEREVHYLLMVTGDWAAWDDTYAFIETQDTRYVAANLVRETFYGSAINLICFFDLDGALVWGEAHDLKEEQPVPLEPLMLLPRTLPQADDEPPVPVGGIVMTETAPMFVASSPILTSENEGPSRGTVVMGRLLSPSVMAELQHQTQVDFGVRPIRGGDEGDAQLLARIVAGEGVALDDSDAETLHIAGQLVNLHGVPELLLEARIPRTVTIEARRFIRMGLLSAIVASLLFLLALMIALRHTVISPISRLTTAIVRIGKSDEMSERLACDRHDEIGQLAREFNCLLDRIEANVQQRVEAAEALRLSEAHMRAIMKAARDAVFTVNPSGVLESANPAAQSIFGWSVEQLVGQPTETLFYTAENIPGGMGAILEEASRLPEGFRNEITGIRLDGTTFPAYVMVKDYTADSGTRYVLFVADLTEIKNMHERLLRDRHLASIGEMGASIAHEIRNPLTGISSALQVLKKDASRNEEERALFEDILAQVKRVDHTVRSLLTFAKPWNPDRRWCNLKVVLARAWDEIPLHDAAEPVTFSIETDDHIMVFADPDLAHQVFCNILRNAALSLAEGGQIRATTRADAEHVFVSIADNGSGMEPDVLEKAMRPFFTTRVSGTGLGLAICQRIVEAHGGSIRIDSVLGTGTEVVVTFPVEKSHAQTHSGG